MPIDPITLSTGISAGTSLISGFMGSRGSDDAARAIAAQQARTREDLMPWMEAGGVGLEEMGRMLYDPTYQMQGTPGYDWRVSQGMQAISRKGAATGGLLSGGRLMALQDLGQNMASAEFANRFDRLRGMSESGRAAAAGVGQMGASAAQGIGQARMQGAEYRGAGLMGLGTSIQRGVGDYSFLQGMNRLTDVYANPQQTTN